MRKLTLFIATLLLTVAKTVAFEASTSVASPEHQYFITNGNKIRMAANTAPTQNNPGKFAFFAVGDNAYKIYSVDKEQWVSYDKTSTTDNTKNFATLVEKQDAANAWKITSATIKGGASGYNVVPFNNDGTVSNRYWNWNGGVNVGGGYSYDDTKTVGLWRDNASSDSGSGWVFTTEINYTLTDAAGNIYEGTSEGVIGESLTLSGVVGYTFDDENWDGNNYAATINFPFPVSKEGGVTNMTTIASVADAKKWCATDDAVIMVQTSGYDANDNDWLWAIYPQFANGAFSFKIKSIGKDKWIYTNTSGSKVDGGNNDDSAGNAAGAVQLTDEGTAFAVVNSQTASTYAFHYKVGNSNQYLSINSKNDTKVYLGVHTGIHVGSDCRFSYVKTVTPPAFDGEGTAASPYLIDSADKLATLRDEVNGGEAYEGVYFKLTSDIALSGEWTAIGTGSRSSKSYTGNAFKGVFDGDNNTISGLTITSTTGADAAIGLFGVVDGGTVKNLNLEVNINVTNSNLAGAAIGMMLNGATAEAITVSGAVVGNDGVGGIVGRVIIDGTIANCINNASVTSSYGGIGGIVGKAYYEDGANKATFATVTGCTNKGTVTAPMYVGGIAGLARANVSGCVNEGAVVGGTQTGGIVGQLMAAGTVSGNENKAKVSGKSHVGGIIGDYSQSVSYTYNNVTIANNVNRGELAATEQCAAILGCNNIDGFTAMTATGNQSFYFTEGLELFGNPEDMVIDATNKFVVPVAQVGEQTFYTLAEAAAAAQAGSEIKLLADIEGDITVPAGVIFNGNGFAVSGAVTAAGEITFKNVTKVGNFGVQYVNTTVNIPAGASLQLTGTGRMVIGHGCTFNITGTIEDAKTADKATLVPSLKIAAGASITGNGVTFNVNNAYIVANANTTSKNSNANGTLDFNINNSIWEQTGVLAFYVPTSGKDPVVNFELKNSVLTTTSHLVFSVTKGEVVIDNSLVNEGTQRQLENRSTMTIKNGSVVNGAVATSSNAINPGTIIVENATYAVTGEFSGAAEGTGTLIIKKGATVSAGSITKANITVDAEGMTAADEINLTANLSKLAGELSVINNDKLDAQIVDGKVVLAAKPVAKIGETPYTTLEAAFAAATEGQTIAMLDNATPALASQRAITKAAVIDLGGKTLTLKEDDLYFGTTKFQNGTIIVDPSVKPSTAVFWMFANQTLTFDNVKIVATGVTGTYLIGLEGENSDLNLLNGSEILVENTTALDLDIICVNGENTCDIKVENSKVNVTNIDGRVFFRGNYTVKDSEVNLSGITKAGFRIEAGQTLSIEGTSKVNIEGEPRDGGIHMTDLSATYTKAETATVNATVNEPKVAKVGENTYRTLAQAVAAVEDGGTITLIANETFTKTNRTHNSGTWYDGLYYVGDKSFTIDLGGFTISQDGAVNDYLLNFKNSGSKANTITLKNGTIDAGTAAFCAICTSSSQANELTINTENINIINNISNGSTIKLRGGAVLNVKDGTKITGKNSYLGIECVASTVNIYDGAEIYMNGTSSYNGCLVGACAAGTVNVYGGYGKGVKGGFIAMTSGGTINIEGGEWIANTDGTVGNNSNLYVLTAQSNKNESGFAGPSIINVTGGTFRGGMDAWVLNNHKDEKAELNISGGNFNANPTKYVENDYIAVENNGVWNVELAAAKIGKQGYATIKDAVAKVKESETITILAGTHSEGTIKLPATLKNVTIKGAEGAELKDMTISAADGNAYSYVGLTFDGITFDNSRILLTGWRNGDEIIKNLAVTNCTFKNLNDNTNTAPIHINKEASEPVNGFTFTNNVIDGATGGSKSGVYAQVTGEVKVENNIINNVSFRPYVIQVTTDDGIADNFTVKGNTFSGSAAGRAQGLGNNAEGTDNVNLVVSNNIFKGITDAQQICYWNFNPETTTADLSKNYYDIDIVTNPGKIYFNSAAADNYALRDMNVFPIYTALNENGTINTESAFTPKFYIAKVGENSYETLSEAFAAVTDDAQTVVVLRDVTENLTGAYLRGNITTENGAKVTINLTNSDWVACPYTFVLGENVTLNVNYGLFYYAGGSQINGTVVTSAYYQRYAGTKLTINEPGSMTVTSETCIIRYMDGDANAGIYINGDNNDETVGLNLAVAYFYQGMINAKNANIKAGTYWQTNETDGQGSANLVLDNSKLVVSVYDHPAKATGNSTVTLTNGSVIDAKNGGFTYGDNTALSVDATSKIIGKGDVPVQLPVATINGKNYTSLQAAIDAVQNGETITLTDNVAGNVTLTEKVGLYYTIDGNGKKFNGTISLNSLSDTEDNRRITIKNINFEDAADANVDFISSVNTNHYPRLTVEGCTFTGSGNDGDVAIRLKSSHSVVIKDCTGTGLHSFLQNTSGWNLTIEKVTVTDSKSAFALGTVQGVTVKGCEANVEGYGIRLDAQYNNNAVIESNKIEAFIPVVVRKAEVNSNITVQGTNEMTATNTDGIWFAAGTSEYEENGKMPTAATAEVKVALTDTGLDAAGIYGSYYDSLVIYVGATQNSRMVTRDIYVATMDEAVAEAKAINAGAVIYKVYGEVELTTGGSHGILDLGKNVVIEGADATAKLTIVGGGVPDIKGVTFKNIILADEGTYLPTANEFMYQNYIDCTFENVTFVDGIRLSGTSSIKDSKVDANTANEYAIWLDEGEFTMTGTTVVGGADAYGLVKSDNVSKITITDNTFQYLGEANKEALNIKGAVVVAENNKFIDCTKGVLPADKTNYTDDSKTTVATDATIAGNNTVTVYYAAVGEQKFETLLEAINAVQDGQTIELIRDVTMDYNARDAYETQAQNVVINGNGNTLTLNQKNSDWASFGLANNSKLILKNMTIEKTGYGDTNGAWNTHAIIFSCPLEMTDVTVNNAVAVQAGAALANVTINEANGYYGLWINGNGQAVTVNGGAINATNGGRGIKIADQYIDAPAQVTLSVDGTVFNTAKKAAVLVSSTAGAQIAAANVNIANVAEDSENFVWVDEDWAQHFANVEVTGATVRAEGVAAFTAAITANGAVQAYYKTLAAAIKAAKAGETITLLQDVKESVTISKNLTIDGADKTITGMITTDGKGLKITIKNVKFDGNNKSINYAMRADDNNKLVVENCTVNNYIYGFLYANKSNDKVVVKNVTVENCAEYGAYLVAVNSASFENFTVKGNTKYGVAVANAGARTVNLKNVSFENAETPLNINEIGTGKVTFNFSGSNDMSKAEFYTSQYVNVVAAAQVGTKVCGSLQDAVVAANDGETVKVLADVNMTTANFVTQVDGYATLVNVVGKAVTIDLNGKKVTVNAANADLYGKAQGNMLMSVFHADPNGTLTLTDSSAEGTGTVELFANDATVYGLIVSENAYDKSNPGKIIINGGNYIADKLADSMIFADINEVITVNGGNFHLGNVGSSGVNGKPWIFNASGNNQIHINVNGGTYNANVAKQHWTYEVNLGEGLTTTNNGDGTWTVVPGVAAVDEELFGSIQEAINAAQNGETVKLIADVVYTDADVQSVEEKPYTTMLYVQGKNITLDLNGKKIDVTYTGSLLYSVVLVSDGAGLTVTGEGSINAAGLNAEGAAAKNIAYLFWKRGETGYLTIENGTFHMNDAADSMVYTNGDEIVTITGGTFTLDAVASQDNGFPVLFNAVGNNERQIVVNGGTFNYDINHQIRPFEPYVAPEKAVKKVGDMWTIVPAQAYVTELLGEWVTEPGTREHNVGYATVAEAIAATNNLGKTVTVVSDATMSETAIVAADKNITLDLNGKVVSMENASTAAVAMIKNEGNLTIVDNSEAQNGKISFKSTTPSASNAYASNTISNYGTLTINAGTIENLSTGGACYALDNYAGSTATINGGELNAEKTAVRIFNWTDGEAAKATLNMNGGEIYSKDGYGINVNSGNAPYVALNISSGTITTDDTDYNLAVYVVNKGTAEHFTANVTDGTFNGFFALNGVTATTMAKGAVSVTGGTFDGVICYADPAYGFISGEETLFKSAVPANYCAANWGPYSYGDGIYGVEYLFVDELTIVDGEYEEFENQNAKTVGTLTYERTLNTGWNALYVPFEIPVDVLTALGYEAAFFYDVHFEVLEGGEINPESAPDVHLIKIKKGTLKANFPYVIRASQNADPNMSLELNDVTLYSTAASEMNSVEAGSTINRFIFAGTYTKATREQLTGDTDIPCYAITPRGTFQKMSATAKLTPFRVFMYIVAKDGSPVILNDVAAESIQMRVIGEENEDGTTFIYDVENDVQTVDYIYDLQGRRVLEPQKGNLYIINGKKVIF